MNNLPKGVSIKNKKYSLRFREDGKNKRVILCPVTSSTAQVWTAYENFLKGDVFTVNKMFEGYTNSSRFKSPDPKKRLAVRTQEDYHACIAMLAPVFGKMRASAVTTSQIQRYIDNRKAERRANYERTVFSNAYKWARSRKDEIKSNPAEHTQPYKMIDRDRYITHNEFAEIIRLALPVVKVAAIISYCCASRISDVLALKWSDITGEGIFIAQGKTNKKQTKLWNDDLRKAVNDAKNTGGISSAVHVITNRSGNKYTRKGFQSLWTNTFVKANVKGATFHDIKAKSISDYEGDKRYFSGHQSTAQMERYNRTPDKVEALAVPVAFTNKRVKK